MKQAILVAAMVSMSVTVAFAGKAERDYMTKEVKPQVQKANEKVKAACGCDIHVTIDESTLTTKDDMRGIRYMAEHITEDGPKYCTDDASKKAVCQLKSLVLLKTPKAEFKFDNGKGLMSTDGQSNSTWSMVTRVIDK